MAIRSNLSPGAGRAKARIPCCGSAAWPDVDTLGLIAMFCGAGLLVLAMLFVIYAPDLITRLF
jgi:hypothetical protein